MKRLGVGVLAALAFVSPVVAQRGTISGEENVDPIARALFDPQLILKFAKQITLTSDQRRRILDEIRKAETELAPIKIDMAELGLELADLLEDPRVEESAILAQLDKVFKTEQDVKKRQVVLLIRIKNVLTEQQQTSFRMLRAREAKEKNPGGIDEARDDAGGTR